MGGGSLSIEFGILGVSSGRRCVLVIGADLRHPAAVGRDQHFTLDRFRDQFRSGPISPSPASAATSCRGSSALGVACHRGCRTSFSWLATCRRSLVAGRSVLARHPMVRCQPCVRTAQPLGLSFSGLVLGLPRLEHPCRPVGHHHHRLGVGHHRADALDLPQYRGHAARDRLQRHRARVSVANHRLGFAHAFSSFRFRGCCAGSRSWLRVADSRWSKSRLRQRLTRAHLRSRSEPSCATDATSVPSCLKIMPRVRPRPPCALGESCA